MQFTRPKWLMNADVWLGSTGSLDGFATVHWNPSQLILAVVTVIGFELLLVIPVRTSRVPSSKRN